MTTKATSFLLRHNFPLAMDVASTASSILDDMRDGLAGLESGEDMFKTWLLPPESAPKNESVIVIDAGGTNFRSCLVFFDAAGAASITDFRKTKMPGVERELSKKEFFDQIADNIDYLKNKSDKIGFCFSYAMEITKDGDGIPNAFSKEVKAPEVIGVPVGKTLVEVLEGRGWNRIKRITLLNDTVAALLAGKAFSKEGTDYSAYIGFILGTGMNAAYVQPDCVVSGIRNDNDGKEGGEKIEKQIIVCESGKCDRIPLSDFDREVDRKTNIPGQYLLEKGCSGAYLGKLGFELLLAGAKDGLFSSECAQKIAKLDDVSLIELDSFLYAPFKSGKISDLCQDDTDRQTIYELFDSAVDRVARYAAAILTATAIQTGGGKSPIRPVAILCNGTTFFKTHKLRSRIESYLEDCLTKRMGVHFEIVSAENDITIGTAVAAVV
nr:hexokinase [Treponema sp.]